MEEEEEDRDSGSSSNSRSSNNHFWKAAYFNLAHAVFVLSVWAAGLRAAAELLVASKNLLGGVDVVARDAESKEDALL